MSAVEAFLQMLDDAWSDDWESVGSSLREVTEAEAEWQHPAYRDCAREPDWPPPGSVRWQVAHLASCKSYYARVIEGRKAGTEARFPPRVPLPSLALELEALDAAHAEERRAFASVRDEDLGAEVAERMTLSAFLALAVRHDSWHAGQIAVARRLFRNRGIEG